jgi:hypothetical protein
MHIIEKRWVDIQRGYQTVRSLERRLQSDWKRAIPIAHRRSDLTAETKRQRIQQITWISVLVFFLLCMLLWVGIYYLPKIRSQLLIYVCVLVIMGSLAGAVYLFWRGTAGVKKHTPPSFDLVGAWWQELTPKRYAIETHGGGAEIDFLNSLSFLDDNYIAVWGLLTSARIKSDTDVLLLGPNGIWVFEVKYWSGTISRRNGHWSAEYQRRPSKAYVKGPDEQWLDQKNEIAKTIRKRLPAKAWLADFIKGGIVFAHEKAVFGEITGHQAAYGRPEQWRKRIRETEPVENLGLAELLDVLDALVTYANQHEAETLQVASAVDVAKRLYSEKVAVLRNYVAERIQ